LCKGKKIPGVGTPDIQEGGRRGHGSKDALAQRWDGPKEMDRAGVVCASRTNADVRTWGGKEEKRSFDREKTTKGGRKEKRSTAKASGGGRVRSFLSRGKMLRGRKKTMWSLNKRESRNGVEH